MRRLIGANGAIKVVILVKWTEHPGHILSGILEVYKNNCQGIPTCVQSETIFLAPPDDPVQQLEIGIGEILPATSPSGVNKPNAYFPLTIQYFRARYERTFETMGYTRAVSSE